MLKLLGKPHSINVRKVLWVCGEIGLEIQLEHWGSGYQDTQTDEFKKLNPNAMVPVLIEDDFVLWESNTICRYLAASRAAYDLLPEDLRARALIEKWMDWQATELNNSWRYAFMSLVREHPDYQHQASLEAGIKTWNHHMHILDTRLRETNAYVAGPDFTLADVVLGLATQRWMATPIPLELRPELPAVNRYYERLSERPHFMKFGRNGNP